MAAPGVSGVHDVKFGQSFLQDDGEHAPLFAFRYSQKPQSLDTTRPGTLSANPANPAALLASFPAVSSGSGSASSESGKGKDKHDHWFTAQQVPSKEVDCILVWDDEAQTFVLERLDSTVKLSHDRAPRASLQHHSLPASPNLHSSTNSQPRASQDSQLDADGSTDSSDGEIRVPSVPPKHLRKIASDRARQALHAVDEPRGRPRSRDGRNEEVEDFGDFSLGSNAPPAEALPPIAHPFAFPKPAAAATPTPTPTPQPAPSQPLALPKPSPPKPPAPVLPQASPVAKPTPPPPVPAPAPAPVASTSRPRPPPAQPAAPPPRPPPASKRPPPKERAAAPQPGKGRRRSSVAQAPPPPSVAKAKAKETSSGSDEDSSDDSSDDDDDEDEEDSGPEGYLAVPGSVLSRSAGPTTQAVASGGAPPRPTAGGKMPLKAPPPRPMSGGKMPIKAPPARIEQSSDDDDDDDDDESESESEMEALASNINATMVDSGGRRRSITGASGRGRVASKGLAAAQPQRPQVGRKGPAPAAVAGRIAQKGLARKAAEPVLKPEDDVPESSEED